jgi:DNA-binding response OmpR family regulator
MSADAAVLALAGNRRNLELLSECLARFEARIWSRCERLRQEGIPFLVLARRRDARLERESLARGARAVLVKPLPAGELLRIVAGLLEGEGVPAHG